MSERISTYTFFSVFRRLADTVLMVSRVRIGVSGSDGRIFMQLLRDLILRAHAV
jgi:hypothetical protein